MEAAWPRSAWWTCPSGCARRGLCPKRRRRSCISPASLKSSAEVHLPESVSLREVTSRADLQRIARARAGGLGGRGPAELACRHARVGAGGRSSMRSRSWSQRPVRPSSAPRGSQKKKTEIATLWGGATLPEWRRRGLDRATVVAYRATPACRAWLPLPRTHASDDSRPILERLGFTAVTTTTPYVWSPDGSGNRAVTCPSVRTCFP